MTRVRPRENWYRDLWLFVISLMILATAIILIGQTDRVGQLARQNATVVHQIQADRERSIRESCQDTNSRHDETLKRLNRRIEDLGRGRGPEVRAQLRQSREFSAFLIEGIVPRQDCDRRVQRYVTSPEAP